MAQPAGGSRVVSYKAIPVPDSELDFILEQCIMDASGHTQRPLMVLPPRFSVQAAATSGSHNLYLLRKVYGDSVQLLLTDSLGRVQRHPRQSMPNLGTLGLLGLPGNQGFILTYPAGKGSHRVQNVIRLNLDLSVRWHQQITDREYTQVQRLMASDSHLWITLARSLSTVTSQPQLWTARLATGEVTGNTALSVTENIEAAVLVPAGLLLLGTTHRNYAPKLAPNLPEPASRRRDIVRLLTPNGQQVFYQTLAWPAPGRPQYYWQTARMLPDSSYQFVGETYREVPNGGALALAAFGLGLAGVMGYGFIPTSGYTNLRPVGLVVARLGPAGQLIDVYQPTIPETMHISPADSSSALPKGRPIDFRVRGLSTSQQQVVLSTSRQVLLYSLVTHQLQPLTPARHTTPTVLSIDQGYIDVGWTLRPGDALPEVEHVLHL